MEYNNLIINGITPTKEEINKYIDGLVGKIFAVLAVYEDCAEQNNFKGLDSYVYRVESELSGFYQISNASLFMSVSSILADLRAKLMDEEFLKSDSHKRVKSLVFHSISIIKKAKVE